jgi:hypothetical protein
MVITQLFGKSYLKPPNVFDIDNPCGPQSTYPKKEIQPTLKFI